MLILSSLHFGDGLLEEGIQFCADIRSVEAEFDVGFEKIEFVADVVAFTIETEAEHWMFGEHGSHRVRELDLVVFPAWGVGKITEDFRSEDVTAGNGEIRRGFLEGRFLDEFIDLDDAVPDLGSTRDSVAGDFVVGDLFEGDDGGLVLVVDLEELLEDGTGGIVAFDKGVPEEEGEGFVAAEGAAAGDGIAEALKFRLPDVVDVGDVRDLADLVAEFRFASFLEFPLKLRRSAKVFLDGAFCPADDHEDLLDPRADAFFDDILDGGFVDYREHLLGDGLGDGEKAGSKASGWDDGFANGHG
jgi:hypothetical protein